MKRILCALALALSACATIDQKVLETASIQAYKRATGLVIIGAMSKEDGAKALEEGDRLSKQYAGAALIGGLPQESQAVKDARAELVAALK